MSAEEEQEMWLKALERSKMNLGLFRKFFFCLMDPMLKVKTCKPLKQFIFVWTDQNQLEKNLLASTRPSARLPF